MCLLLIIAVYVDDLLIAVRTDERIKEVKSALGKIFDVKYMGELHYFLAVKVVQDLKADRMWIGQPTHIRNLISHFMLRNAKTCKTPTNRSLKLMVAIYDSV